MMKVPSMVVFDDFYDDPQAVLALANSLPYQKAVGTNYPGERTDHLQKVAPTLFAEWEKKFLDIFFGANLGGEWEFSTQFQRIPASADNPSLNEGWVHSDTGWLVGGAIYLNEQPHAQSGTALMRAKSGSPDPNANLPFRNAYYGGRMQITDEEFAQAKAKHNDRFDTSVVVANQFNRMVAFNPELPHRQNGFGMPGTSRLTQVFFARIKND